MNKKKTLEREAADAVLQVRRTIVVGNKTYRLPRPTAGTLIELSAVISEMPTALAEASEETILVKTLRYAKDCAPVGRAVAVMMVGAWLCQFGSAGRWLFGRRVERRARRLLARHTPSELEQAATKLLRESEVEDFFVLSAFLSGINLLRPTREAETTVSGPSSAPSPNGTASPSAR